MCVLDVKHHAARAAVLLGEKISHLADVGRLQRVTLYLQLQTFGCSAISVDMGQERL